MPLKNLVLLALVLLAITVVVLSMGWLFYQRTENLSFLFIVLVSVTGLLKGFSILLQRVK